MKDHKHRFEVLEDDGYLTYFCEECGYEMDYTVERMIKQNELDVRPIIAKTMRACGLTYKAIGIRLGMSKQAVEKMVKQ